MIPSDYTKWLEYLIWLKKMVGMLDLAEEKNLEYLIRSKKLLQYLTLSKKKMVAILDLVEKLFAILDLVEKLLQ